MPSPPPQFRRHDHTGFRAANHQSLAARNDEAQRTPAREFALAAWSPDRAPVLRPLELSLAVARSIAALQIDRPQAFDYSKNFFLNSNSR
jgi:hypothetical protein